MGRRLTLLLAAVATMVVVSAGVALAANIIGTNQSENCGGLTPPPSNNADNITLAGGNDQCNARGGADQVYGDSGDDQIQGGGGTDALYGGGGQNDVDGQGGNNDFVSVVDNDGDAGFDDTAVGGSGTGDTCAVDDQSEADRSCENVLVAQ